VSIRVLCFCCSESLSAGVAQCKASARVDETTSEAADTIAACNHAEVDGSARTFRSDPAIIPLFSEAFEMRLVDEIRAEVRRVSRWN